MHDLAKFSVLLLSCLVNCAWAQAQTKFKECIEGEGGCKRCRGDTCARCAVLLHKGACVDSCPTGHTADWSTRDEYMGRICKESAYAFGLTGSQLAILVGVVSGATICVFIVLCGAIVVHRRKKKASKIARRFDNSADRADFLKHLATLRGDGHTFLSMLNDTRRQVRELYYSGGNGDGAVGIQAYRPVLRDLARILVLVNRRDEEIQLPPDDWRRLFSWAERLLRRYKRHSSPEVAQLVTFLQHPTTPLQVNPSERVTITRTKSVVSSEPRNTQTMSLTTFQANLPLATFQASDKSSISPASSSLDYAKDNFHREKLSPNGSATERDGDSPLVRGIFSAIDDRGSIRLDREINPQWEFQSAVEAANYTILSDSSLPCDYLVDDFTVLGFRPQDEITTEL